MAGLVLFLLPGTAFLAALRREDRAALRFDEALFLLVGVSVAVSSWIALVLGEAGLFSTPRAAALLSILCGAVLVVAWRTRHGLSRLLPTWPGLRALLGALAVLATSLALHTRPSEYLVGGRDPGAYLAAMALLGRTGGITYVDPVVLSIPKEDVALFYRNPEKPDWEWGRFMGMPLERPETGRVVPEFFHLFPAFGAYLFQAMGVRGALATPCVFGVLGTLAVFFAWRRVFDGRVALVAALLLAVNVVQVWFARYPVAEPMLQFLVFLGLLAFALWEETDAPAFAALAGASLGLSFLVRIDAVLLLAPLAAYVVVRRAQGMLSWRRLMPLLAPLAVLAAHAVVHALFWARKYAQSVLDRPYWSQPGWVWLAAAALVVTVALGAHRLEAAAVRWSAAHGAALRRALMAAVVILAAYAAVLRPHLSAWAGGDGNDARRMISNFSALDADADGQVDAAEYARRSQDGPAFERFDEDQDGKLSRREWRGDPPETLRRLGFPRLAAHDAQALVRLGWFVSPIVLALALFGFARALAHWERRWLFPIFVVGTFTLFYLYKIRIQNDYFFALRRFLPIVIPGLLALAAFALADVWARGKVGRLAATALTVMVAGLYLKDTLPLVRYRDWNHAVRFVEDVSRRFGPRDVVIFEQPRSVHLLSLPLWAIHGVNALELARFDPDPVRLTHLIDSWRGRYRNVYFVHTYSTDLCGLFLQRVEDLNFGTYEWERGYGRKPRGPEPRALHFRISRVVPPEALNVPPLREIDVGSSDDQQVSGFFDKEGGGDRTYRWTGRCASVYLPGARPGDRVTLRASTGRRPLAGPVPVQMSLAGVRLGAIPVGAEWSDGSLRLPDPLPPGPTVLRLDVPSFRPVNVLPGTDDARDLGIMVDRIRLDAGPKGLSATIPVSPGAGGPP